MSRKRYRRRRFHREPAPDLGVLGRRRCVRHESGAFIPYGTESVQGLYVGGVGGVFVVVPVIVEVDCHDLRGVLELEDWVEDVEDEDRRCLLACR
jgi:hypothetical protein